ncbi:MAG TPA: mechanosensitive ion channel domain-containing protein [Bradyrhizobium sp.]|uniref:mechanosensitive ion channel family protein n=1 Tax=Bradyrhizobium sp. TaxID=376 RepID=UPI002CA82B3D|nr:mechanosensitive ion channel domain-containing protein [Bradyrhizobium sp.]HLZ02071.1 mechanosensitive ion channel domain-containing protein [Bradyrhizobium sp.]
MRISGRSTLGSTFICLLISGIVAAVLGTAPRAFGQTATSDPPAVAAPAHASDAPSQKAPAAPNASVNTGAITQRLNQELGLDLNARIAAWPQHFDRLESDLRRPHLLYSELNAYRDELQRIRGEVKDLTDRLPTRVDATKAQLNLLGPVPGAGQPAEPEQIAHSRAELNYRLGLLSTADAAARSANLSIDHLFNTIEDIRRRNFASIMLQPIPGVYAYETWSRLPDTIPMAVDSLRHLVDGWWEGVPDGQDLARIGLEAALLFVALSFASWRGLRSLRRWQSEGEPPFWRRASSAAGVVLLRALPVTAPVVFAYAMLAAEQRLPDRLDWLFYLTAEMVVIVFTVAALVTTTLAPRAPAWRLIPVSDAGAARLCGLVILLAFFYGLTTLLYAITRLVQAPFALTIAVALPSSLLLAGLVVAILRTPLRSENPTAPSMRLFRAVRAVVWTIVAAIVACALAGYLPLARFLAQQLVVTGSILALVYLLLLWVDGFAQSVADDNALGGRWLKQRAHLERSRREQLALPISLLLKLAVLVFSVPFIMLQWGYTWPDIQDWYRQLFFGFHIANTQVTFGALLASIMVFGLGYAAARLFQGWLDVQVLQPAGISGGVRHSIRTGVGYAGILIAALAAVSYAGFNLSSLAIVAGAFSIGIGFGLQNLVNNFVSGLILLAERPIRVGDLVVVGGEEGYVRKISVRSTEIETFDRAHVLIPNSSFVSDKVKNWTLRNSVRRVTISIGTAYACNPRQVREVLLKVARSNPDVLHTPEPVVDLREFGASSLNFILYVFIDDISKTVRVRTDLSMAIFDAFADAGIEIPFTQTDVNIRNIDRLHELVAHYAAQQPEENIETSKRRFTKVPAVAE